MDTGRWSGASSSGELHGWSAGARVGEYVLVEKLGQGGMGAVYIARHATGGKLVALKLLLVGKDDLQPQELERFRREAESMAAVAGHENVLRVLASGEEAGHPYLVTELAARGDLRERLKAGPLDPTEAARLALALARGLTHVHAQGVLHRDLKPANVVFDAKGTPKLMDFGVARLAGARRLTVTGASVGTPAYMAPEQAGGERLDERVDVYGLGAILYECLTGRPPFQGASEVVLLKQVLTEEPAAPRDLRNEVPDDLDALVRRAMAKDLALRYPRVEAMAEDLERFLAGEPITGGAPRRAARAPLVLAALLLIALGLAAFALRLSAAKADPAVATTEVASETTRAARPGKPVELALRAPADAWTLVPHEQATLALEGAGDRLEVLAGAGGGPLARVATSLPATVELRGAWTTIVVRGPPRPGLPRQEHERHVVRLRAGLRPGPGPGEVTSERDGSALVLLRPGRATLPPTPTSDGPEEATFARPLLLGKHEVSWRQFRAYAAATGAALPPAAEGGARDEEPVYNVTLAEAQAYCAWAGLRLPRYPEWLYGVTGGDGRRYPWGTTWQRERANLSQPGDAFPRLAPVDAMPEGRSPFGLHHGLGNVWEWVLLPARSLTTEQPVVTGSGWSNPPGEAERLGAALTAMDPPDDRRGNNGFRAAADLEAP